MLKGDAHFLLNFLFFSFESLLNQRSNGFSFHETNQYQERNSEFQVIEFFLNGEFSQEPFIIQDI